MTKETKWVIDQAHTKIAFKIRHFLVKHVKGTFKIFDANIYTAGNDFSTAQIDLFIDASSINTGDEKRDEHLRGSEFFDVKKHRQITFVSSTIGEPDEDGNRELWGELTIKNITKNVKLMVQFTDAANDAVGNEKAGFELSGQINRTDWGLIWNKVVETGGFMISEEVSISCKVELHNTDEKNLTMRLVPDSAKKVIL